MKHFYTNRERCDVLTGYFSLDCQSTGQIRDIGQNVIQSSLQAANSSTSYFHSSQIKPFVASRAHKLHYGLEA
jgi:hypothetical protein